MVLFGRVFADWLPSSRKLHNHHEETALAPHKIPRKLLIGRPDFYGQFVYEIVASGVWCEHRYHLCQFAVRCP